MHYIHNSLKQSGNSFTAKSYLICFKLSKAEESSMIALARRLQHAQCWNWARPFFLQNTGAMNKQLPFK